MQIYDGRNDIKATSTKHTVAVVSTNRIICGESDQMTIRKNGREDWSLFYCESGRLFFGEEILSAGQVWIYAPKVPQKYTMYGKDKTIYHYLHFTGSDVSELLSSLGIALSAPIGVERDPFVNTFENIQNFAADDNALSRFKAEYHTLYLISMLARRCTHFSETTVMKRVTDNMEHSFTSAYDALYYADMLRISVSRFNHLFKQCIGISPYAYYVKLRMENACGLLEGTDLRIRDIAERCGYDDTLYFAQVFKKSIGLTPTQYRRMKKIT